MSQAFRPRARLLQLLGDQLIGSPRLALFELVENAYDADAHHVQITFEAVDRPDARIVVRDDGQLLMAILVHSATHAIRPGTLRF